MRGKLVSKPVSMSIGAWFSQAYFSQKFFSVVIQDTQFDTRERTDQSLEWG